MENLKTTIEELNKFDRYLLGAGYDNALKYIDHLIGLDVIEIPSGTKLGTWVVPDEWIIKEAWVKFNDKKIVDFKDNPLSVVIGSKKIHGWCKLDELRKHLHYSDDLPNSIPYIMNFYEDDWGFCVPKNFVLEKISYDEEGKPICEGGQCVDYLKMVDPSVGKIQIEGEDYKPKFKDKMEEGDYEVFIDTERVPSKLKIGVHTIKGKLDKEILLFAHLDHPFQANDNLSAVACLIDLAKKLKSNYTIKIIFCPETIGSIAYALMQDISKVEFVIAVDICGNDNSLLLQHTHLPNKINRIAHLAIQSFAESFRKAPFRGTIGSDEYVFNDPMINIPAIMLSRHPYKEYHTSEDTLDKINFEKITRTGDIIKKIIEIYENDFIPVRKMKAPLMRSKFNMQTPNEQANLSLDYWWYGIDGERSLSDLVCDFGLNWDYIYEKTKEMINAKCIGINNSKRAKQATSKKKPS